MADPQVKIVIKAVDNASKEIHGIGSAFKSVGKIALGVFGGNIMGSAFAALKTGITDSIKKASDLNETMSKTKVIFGDSADVIIDKSGEMADAAGLSSQAYMDAAATFGVFGKSAGLAGDDLAGFSGQMVQLSADMASFSNTTPEDAIMAIGAALRGESEPIRRYGVLLDDATLRQKALELGIVSSIKNALTPQQRVLAAQKSILEQTSDAQGDFARTSDGLANQQRILTAEIDNAKVAIGTGLLPTVIDITSAGVDFIQVLTGTYDAAKHAEDGISDLDNAMKVLSIAFQAGVAQVAYQQLVEDGVISNKRNLQVQKKVYDAFWDNEKLLEIYNDEIEGYIGFSEGVTRQDEIRRAGIKKLSAAIVGAVDNSDKWTYSVSENKEAALDAFNALQKLNDETLEAARVAKIAEDAILAESIAMSDIEWIISQPLTSANEDFIESQEEIHKQIDELNVAMNDLVAQGYDPMGEKVMELRGKHDELIAKYDEDATAHEKATERILFDLLIQKLGLQGLLDADLYRELAEQWGLVGQAEIDAMINADEAVTFLATYDYPAIAKQIALGIVEPADAAALAMATADGNARGLAEALAQLHDINLTVTTTFVNAGSMAPSGGPPAPGYVWNGHEWVPGGHSGLDMIVPSGFNHDNYPIMAESGERVVIIPKNQQGNTVNNNSFSMNIHTNAQTSSLMGDFNKMKAWAN